MYSVDNEASYQSVIQWQADIERYCPPHTRVLIIGNKCDLPTRAVPVEQGLLLSSRLGAPFMESSAKENINVRSVSLKRFCLVYFRSRMLYFQTFRLLAKMMLDERKASLQSQKMEEVLFDFDLLGILVATDLVLSC